jgi:hypothetical protein
MSLVFFKEALDNEDYNGQRPWILNFNIFKQFFFTSFLSNYKLMNYKWIFNIKYNADGFMARHKIHLVATRFLQGENIDFNATYCLVT